jgi:multicomponent Na+:H+ antiporter subunit D
MLFNMNCMKITFKLDQIGVTFFYLIMALSFISLLHAVYYTRSIKLVRRKSFFFWIFATVVASMMLAFAGNLFTMFVMYEILTVLTIPLINHDNSINSSYAVGKYLKILMIPSVAIMLPAVVISGQCGNAENFALLHNINDNIIMLLITLFSFGIAKTSIFPFFGWITTAMVAQYPVSGLLHAVIVVKAGIFCLAKVLVYVIGIDNVARIMYNFNFLSWIAAIGMVYSSWLAIMQTDLKKILAYSTISQLHTILLAFFTFDEKGIKVGIGYTLLHGCSKLSLFFSASNIYSTLKSNCLSSIRGAAHLSYANFAAFVISALILSGFPFLPGFYGKLAISGLLSEHWVLKYAFYFSGVLTSCYFSRVILVLLAKPQHSLHAHKIPLPIIIITLVCACLIFTISNYETVNRLDVLKYLAINLVGFAAAFLMLFFYGVNLAPERKGFQLSGEKFFLKIHSVFKVFEEKAYASTMGVGVMFLLLSSYFVL